MTTRHYTLEDLQRRKEQTAHRIAAYEQRMKRIVARQRRLAKQITAQTETERRNRLIARGELLESLLPSAEKLTDDQLRTLLDYAFQQDGAQDLIAQMTQESEGETPHEEQSHL